MAAKKLLFVWDNGSKLDEFNATMESVVQTLKHDNDVVVENLDRLSMGNTVILCPIRNDGQSRHWRDRIQLPVGVENVEFFKIFMSKVTGLSVISMGSGIIVTISLPPATPDGQSPIRQGVG